MKILSVLHDCMAPTGLLGACVARRGGDVDEVTPHDGDRLPATHHAYDGVIVLGGPMDADDDANFPHFQPLIRLLQGFHAAGKPVMGVCLGAQLLSRAFGKQVRRHHAFEIGFTELRITEAGAADPLLQGLNRTQHLMQWHQDTFDLPDDAALLVTGEGCRNQAFRIDRTVYGFQFHLETTRPIVRSWIRSRQDFLRANHPRFLATIERQFDAHIADQMAFTRVVGDRWLDLVEARESRPVARQVADAAARSAR